MADIFISYAREDQERVKPIVDALEKQGWSVFWDRNIPVGQTWRSHIGNALDNASCVLVVWSRNSVNSKWVPQEADEANGRNVYVPILLDDVLPPLGFRDTQAANLTAWDQNESGPHFALLKEAIASFIQRKNTGSAAPPEISSSVKPQPSNEEKGIRQGFFQNSARKKIMIIGTAVFLILSAAALYVFLFEPTIHTSSIKIEPPSEKEQKPAVHSLPKNRVRDIDGNTYKTVRIGNQIWMAENLNVSHYRNGDPIPQVQDTVKWTNLTTGAWCYYENNAANGYVYGKLYNWYAVNDPRGLAPKGWHVPKDGDWTVLERFLGMSRNDAEKTGRRGSIGGKLKETGTMHWRSPNGGATNETGFTALAGGFRPPKGLISTGGFYFIGSLAYFWSSSENPDDHAWYRHLNAGDAGITRDLGHKRYGMSVRCVRN